MMIDSKSRVADCVRRLAECREAVLEAEGQLALAVEAHERREWIEAVEARAEQERKRESLSRAVLSQVSGGPKSKQALARALGERPGYVGFIADGLVRAGDVTYSPAVGYARAPAAHAAL